MSLVHEYPKLSHSIEKLNELKILSVTDARQRLAILLEEGSFDPSKFELFQHVLRGALDDCRVPTVFVADGIQAEIETVERWESVK